MLLRLDGSNLNVGDSIVLRDPKLNIESYKRFRFKCELDESNTTYVLDFACVDAKFRLKGITAQIELDLIDMVTKESIESKISFKLKGKERTLDILKGGKAITVSDVVVSEVIAALKEHGCLAHAKN